MKNDRFLELQLKPFHIFGTSVLDVDVDENRIAADPSLAMKTSRHLDCLCVEFLRQVQFI